MQNLHHSIGLMSMFEHIWLANQLANHETIDEAIREHGLSRIQLYILTVHARDLSAPLTVAEEGALEHAAIRRASRGGEFSGLLQAHTFALA